MFKKIEILESVDSTNTYLKGFLGGAVPRVAAAREQTAGQGRFGRSWISPAGEGLYVSYLFYPSWKIDRLQYLNRAASLAVVQTLRTFVPPGADLRVKEPNDVLLGGRKICGILSEVGSSGREVNWAIVGVGINVFQRSFPPGLEGSATSLAVEGIEIRGLDPLLARLTACLSRELQALESGDWQGVQERYRSELG